MDEIGLQDWVDGMSARAQRERAKTQMTLGQVITALEAVPPETPTPLGLLASYRGYYCDLAFAPGTLHVEEVLADCRHAMGRVYQGYKGGEYLMGESTPLWYSAWGTASNARLMDVGIDGKGRLRIVVEAEE